jgi:mRNA interferase RelE/StbE
MNDQQKPTYEVEVGPKAAKALRKIPTNLRKYIRDRIDSLAVDPRQPGAIELRGQSGSWRVRQGDYRIIYTIDEGKLIVLVVKVAPRGGAYQR